LARLEIRNLTKPLLEEDLNVLCKAIEVGNRFERVWRLISRGQNNKSITSLSMQSCGLGAWAGDSMAPMLANNTTLKWLDVSRNAVFAENRYEAFFTSLTHNASLTRIDLGAVRFYLPAVDPFLQMIRVRIVRGVAVVNECGIGEQIAIAH